MKNLPKGFTLVEFMIAMVLASVVIIAAYKYLIIGTQEMSETVSTVNIRQKAVHAFESIREDLKFVGYNPRLKKWSTATDEKSAYQVKSRKSKPPGASYLRYVNFIQYTSFNPKHPNCPENNLWENECVTFYKMDNEGNIIKEQFDEGTMLPKENFIIDNACLALIYWNQSTDAPCSNQTQLCSKTVKLVLSVVPNSNLVQQFDKNTCIIPDLDFSQYVHLSEKVYLTNLKD